MLKSNDNSRSIDQERPVNTNSSFVSFYRLEKDYGPREYDKSNKTMPSTQTSPSYPVLFINSIIVFGAPPKARFLYSM